MEANEVQILSLADQRGSAAVPDVQMRAVFGTAAMLNVVDLTPHSHVRLHSHTHELLGLVVAAMLILETDGLKHASNKETHTPRPAASSTPARRDRTAA